MELNKIYTGNNIDILKTFDDNSIDSIVTDPPYGLGKEPNALEVLQSWITTGYHEIKGKGFMGKEWDAFVPQPIFWKECLRVLKPGGHLLSFAGTRTYDWVVIGLRIAGFEIRDQIAWLYGSGFPKSKNIGLELDKKNGHPNRGHRISTASRHHPDGTFEPNGGNLPPYKPKTNEAKQWQGWGTALKPALEPIVMARKPLDGTVANNVLKHGVGGINIDGCRVESDEQWQGRELPNAKDGVTWGGALNSSSSHFLGRFPANVIHDGSDEVVRLFPNSEGGGYPQKINGNSPISFRGNEEREKRINIGDSGSSARFFYTAKASQSERNFGLSGFEEKSMTKLQGRKEGSAGAVMENGKQNPFASSTTTKKNIHPTVKPIDLMRYLVRLVTSKGGLCLDPYMGSGTTAVACKAEKINYIGCELEEEYVKIAEARIKAEVVAYDIFDYLEE